MLAFSYRFRSGRCAGVVPDHAAIVGAACAVSKYQVPCERTLGPCGADRGRYVSRRSVVNVASASSCQALYRALMNSC